MAEQVIVDYYSDVLCVWAWIAQRRIDELSTELGEKVALRYHYIDIFGDTETKIQKQWADKGLYQGFADHVVTSAAPYPDAKVSSKIWTGTQPTTSANAHLVLKAIELIYGKEDSQTMALAVRKAFFERAQDIGELAVLYSLIACHGLDETLVARKLGNGQALAALLSDYQSAQQMSLKGSPSYIIDNGRQVLYGNVGYRVLLANIEEIIKQPKNEASWC